MCLLTIFYYTVDHITDTTSLSEEHSLDIIQDIDDKSCLIVTSHIPVPSNYRYEFMTTPKIEVFKLPKEELIIGQDSIKKGACRDTIIVTYSKIFLNEDSLCKKST